MAAAQPPSPVNCKLDFFYVIKTKRYFQPALADWAEPTHTHPGRQRVRQCRCSWPPSH